MTQQTEALAELIAALDAHLYPNDYCGYEISKHNSSAVIDAIEAARAALSSQPPAPSWQPIETAPKGRDVLMHQADPCKPFIGDWGSYCRYNSPGFTHWMPLPAAPASLAATAGSTP